MTLDHVARERQESLVFLLLSLPSLEEMASGSG